MTARKESGKSYIEEGEEKQGIEFLEFGVAERHDSVQQTGRGGASLNVSFDA